MGRITTIKKGRKSIKKVELLIQVTNTVIPTCQFTKVM